MQTAQAAIDRFAALEGEVDPIVWLTETGAIAGRIEDAVEARLTKRVKGASGASSVLTVRLALADLPSLGVAIPPEALGAEAALAASEGALASFDPSFGGPV